MKQPTSLDGANRVLRLLAWILSALAWVPVVWILASSHASRTMRVDAGASALCFLVGMLIGIGVIWFGNSKADSQTVADAVRIAIVILALASAIYSSLAWVTDLVQPRSLCLILLFVGIALAGTLRHPETEPLDRKGNADQASGKSAKAE